MVMKYEALFSPIKIGNVEIPNRIAMMPMGVFSPRLMSHCGAYTQDGADYYIERAKGGTGLIVTGLLPLMFFPKGKGPGYAGPGFDQYVETQKYLADGIHAYGSRIFTQISAGSGRSSFDANDPAPSSMPNVWDPTKWNPEMTIEEIHAFIEQFANAALANKLAGIDGVEIHAVHEGYLLDQFTISNFNHRTDQYGGSLENRLRFPTEVVQAIKAKCGDDFPVSLRYSVKSYTKGFNRGALPGEKFEEFGRDIEESIVVAQKLVESGYDMLDCDNGTYDAWYWPHPPVYMPKALNLEDVKIIKKHVNVPVVCAGKFDDPDLANECIAKGEIDIMGMGRPLLADPDAANKFREGRLEDIRPCIGCHMGCLARIFQGKDLSCAVNPRSGLEKQYAIQPAEQKKKVLVIGGGLGGMEVARVAALRGHEVDLYEKTDQLGGVFVPASQLEYKSDDRRLLNWYKKQIKDTGVHVHFGKEVTADWVKGQHYDEIVVATGASEKKINTPGFDSDRVVYAVDNLMNKNKVDGDDVIVVGGGLTGIEMACDLAKQGKRVTVVELTNTILNAEGLSAANYNYLMEMIDHYHVNVMRSSSVLSYQDGIAEVKSLLTNEPNINNRALRTVMVAAQGVETVSKIKADRIIVSIGYNSENAVYNELKGIVKNLHLIGDAQIPGNVLKTIWSGYELALNM